MKFPFEIAMSQTAAILHHLSRGKSLTALEALQRFGCFRLAARVRELKDMGHNILSHRVERGGKTVALYVLVQRKE